MLVTNLTDEQQTANANLVKDILLFSLEKEGLLTKPAQEITESYAIVLHRKGFFGTIIDKLFNFEDKGLKITIVKLVQ